MTDPTDSVAQLLVAAARIAANQARYNVMQQGAPTLQKYSETTFGNSLVVPAGAAGVGARRLLDVNLAHIDSRELYQPGAWVLSMSAYNDAGDALGGGDNTALNTVPIIARITIGAGGAAIPFEITVLQGTNLQLPAGVVSVDVRAEQAITGANMRVSGILQRGYATQGAILKQFITVPNATTQTFNVPNFARGVRAVGQASSPQYIESMTYTFSNIGGNVRVSGPQMRDLLLRGEWLNVPAARQWSLGKPAATEILYPTTVALDWRIIL
jgi:hypothetical protein